VFLVGDLNSVSVLTSPVFALTVSVRLITYAGLLHRLVSILSRQRVEAFTRCILSTHSTVGEPSLGMPFIDHILGNVFCDFDQLPMTLKRDEFVYRLLA